MPVILSGATSGSTTIQATDAVTATITLPSATTTLVGKTTPSFTTTIGVGNATPSASGAGITFPATQSASTDANTLDDYEEGTWTPVDNSGAGLTFTSVIAQYTKVGRVVHLVCSLTYPSTASVAGASISGYPFPVASSEAACYYSGAAAGAMLMSTTALYPATNLGAAVTNATLSTQGVNFSATYFV